MSASEKKSFIRFLIIYLGSTYTLLTLASWGFYLIAKEHITQREYQNLERYAQQIMLRLRTLHHSDDAILYYPVFKGVDSAIYDLGGRYIFGTLDHNLSIQAAQKQPHKRILIRSIHPYYLGAAKLLVMRPIDTSSILALQREFGIFLLLSWLIVGILGVILGRLFIRPMRDAMHQLNRFIQDTTHELNTPISTILTNIELIESLDKCPMAQTELRRIEIASKTLNRIYEDLSFLNLNHHYHRKIETIDFSSFVKERLLYFRTMSEAKKLRIISDIKDGVKMQMDHNDAIRLVDNLLSNAIKYNKKGGMLHITLHQDRLCIEDEGEGMDQEVLHQVTKRFVRANESEGGFGIGLHIVYTIVKHYHFHLVIKSEKQRGTTVEVRW